MAEPTQALRKAAHDSFVAALPAVWGPPVDAGGPSCTCLHDVALLDGRVLEPAGLLLQVQSCVAERQAGDHVLGDPERALTDLHRVDFWLEWLHLRQQMLKVQVCILNLKSLHVYNLISIYLYEVCIYVCIYMKYVFIWSKYLYVDIKYTFFFPGTFLVGQWLRIHLPRQQTQVRSLVGEPGPHMLWGNCAHTPQLEKPMCLNIWAHVL